jgi:hypothetical protein
MRPSLVIILCSILVWITMIMLAGYLLLKKRLSIKAFYKLLPFAVVIALVRISISLYLDQQTYFGGINYYLSFMLIPELPINSYLTIVFNVYAPNQLVFFGLLTVGSFFWSLPFLVMFARPKIKISKAT